MSRITFKSQNPDIHVPRDVALWSWLFESPHSMLSSKSQDEVKGFTDVTTGQHINYTDLKQLTTYLSTAYSQDCGLGEGDPLLVYARNSVWYPVAMLAAVRIGAIGCGCNPDYSVDELAYALKASKAKLLVASAGNVETAYKAAAQVGLAKEKIVIIDDAPQGKVSLQSLIKQAKDRGESSQVQPYKIPKGKVNHDICAYLGFSSGTTGLPKGVMISHQNVMAQCLQIQQITPEDHRRILAALPFYHITGVVHQLHLPVTLNAHVFVMPSFTLEGLLETVAKYKILELLIVPPILIRITREKEMVSQYDLSHVKRFSSGAAPLSQEILTTLSQQFPGTGFKQGYGMTESCSCITAHPPEKYPFKYAARVGTIVASTEVRIVDPDTGKDCDVGQPGEIWARGPQIAMGYLNNPKATAETFDKEGFLHTGDIGKIDEEGLIAITDRMKEMIKVKGIGVAPAELENLLLGHPSVSDCAVCGIPDDRAGERPKAFVVFNDSHKAKAEEAARELIRYVRKNKSRDKCVVEVEVLEVIPKSPAGKILRKILKDPKRERGELVVRDDAPRARL